MPDGPLRPAHGEPSRLSQLLALVLPERQLDPEARAQFDAEASAINLSRVRNWGLPMLALHGVAMWATARVPVVTLAERLWQRDLLRIYGALQATAVLVLACVALRRGPARAVAGRVGGIAQLSSLVAYALIGVNAQRLHGSIGPYMAVAAASPFLFRTLTAHFALALVASSATLLAGILALQTSPVMRANNVFVVVAYTAFADFCERTGCECAVEVALDEPVHPQVELTTFRITQECLTNVARHARAERVTVTLKTDGTEVVLEITDDGRAHGPIEPGRGLAGMRERALSVGDALTITPREPRGTVVQARLPFEPSFPPPRPS